MSLDVRFECYLLIIAIKYIIRCTHVLLQNKVFYLGRFQCWGAISRFHHFHLVSKFSLLNWSVGRNFEWVYYRLNQITTGNIQTLLAAFITISAGCYHSRQKLSEISNRLISESANLLVSASRIRREIPRIIISLKWDSTEDKRTQARDGWLLRIVQNLMLPLDYIQNENVVG